MSEIYQYKTQSAVRGYHVYREHWMPDIGEILTTELEPNNVEDKHAVAVKKQLQIVGHLL